MPTVNLQYLRLRMVWAVILGTTLAGSARANVITWGGSANASWNDKTKWTGGALPLAGDTAAIASGIAFANADIGISAVRVDAGGSLNLGFTMPATYAVTLNGGTFAMDSPADGATDNGPIVLTAASTILNQKANSNRTFTLNSNISEDATPRKLTFTGYPATAPNGMLLDNITLNGANTWSGGTDIYGPSVNARTASALGTGPVSLKSGRLVLSYAGSFTCGTITGTGGGLVFSTAPTSLVANMQGGSLQHNNSPLTLGNTNAITISNTVAIQATGTNVNNPFTVAANIGGPGKAVLNDFGPPAFNSASKTWSYNVIRSKLILTAAQNWLGNTDVRGLTDVNAGGSLPAGTVTVYGLEASGPLSPGGVLRLYNASNGGLSASTDLVLTDLTFSATDTSTVPPTPVSTTGYASLYLGANVTVHSLTINGVQVAKGVYTTGTDLPNYLYGPGSPKYTLTVLTPDLDQPPTTITNLAASNPQSNAITLSWTAPSDAETANHTAASYDLRYATSAITDATFAAAAQASGAPSPAAPGTQQSVTVAGLSPGLTYYFAMKSADNTGHISALSNVASAATALPDTTPPAAVTDLGVTGLDTRKLTLTWTATGDDGMAGTAASYDIRMSTGPINAGNFAAAPPLLQSLTPKAPGQGETLLVSGLIPGTTYYFAMKVADEVPNVSPLSNVLQVTTLVDNTPPAAVTDLAAAAGSDAFSTDLTWTATGDDGNIGIATRYEVRFATAPINSGNWASAALVPNSLSPQPAGSAEHFTVAGLQPSTLHYFAIKVIDEENNTSALSNVVSLATGPLPDLPRVTGVTIVEKAGQTTTNYPVTLSLAFKKGDVADCVTVRAAGVPLATQTDAKVRYSDGSVKHALVSFILPQLQANQTMVIDVLAGGVNANRYPISRDVLLAQDFDARMAITIAGTTTTISAHQMLQATANPETWIKGDLCTEFLLKDFGTNINNQINVQYRVRVYRGYTGYRAEAVVENTWCQYRGNVTYDFTYSIGQASPVTVLSKTGFTHNQLARWHETAWSATTPGKIQIKFDVPYLISTGLIQRYDTSLVMAESTLAGAYSGWQGKPHDLMDPGIVNTYFPTTGGREEIGILPTWTVRYLLSLDERQKEIMLNCADVSGYIPIHYRESDPTRSFYGRVMTINDRPTVWAGWWDYTYQDAADRLPAPVGDTTTAWSVDLAHQASFAYVPYLVTGEYYYLEEMMFWGGFDLSTGNSGYRQGSTGLIVEQTRGEAWGIRNVGDAASMAPDGFPEKPYFTQKVNNNLTYWSNTFILSPNYPSIHYWEDQSNSSNGGRPDDTLATSCMSFTSPWMDDFVLLALGHLKDIGFDSRAILNWLGTSAISRFTAPGFNWYRGTSYHIPTQRDDGTGHAVAYATWADIDAAYVDADPTSFAGSDNPGSYDYIARAALTRVAHLVNGQAARNWLDANHHNQAQLASDPTMAILPAATIVGDVNADGSVDVVDLLYFVDCFGLTYGVPAYNPDCDFNGDAAVDVVDLLYLVDAFGQSL